MEKLVNKEYYLDVPGFLHELHGERSNWRDIGLTHTAAVGITALLIWVSAVAGHPLWMTGLLAFLMYDIAGGVVSNFTRSTNDFYAKHPQKRLVFLSLHVIQPAILAFIFPNDAGWILSVMAYTLSVSFWLNRNRKETFQKTLAPFSTITGITAVLLLPIDFPGLKMLLLLYIIKLALAFSVDWYKNS